MSYNQIRSLISTIAGYAALICGVILVIKLLRIGIPISGDAGFWTSCCVAAIALR